MRSSVLLVSLLAAIPFVASQTAGLDPSAIPAACLNAQCQDYVDAVTKSTCAADGLSCLCTNSVASSMKTCLQCLVTSGLAGFDQSILDNTIDSFTGACAAAGHAVTISGSSGGTGTSSGSGGSSSSGTQTAAGSKSTATTPATGGGSGGSVTKTSGASKSSFHLGGLVAGAALAGAVLL